LIVCGMTVAEYFQWVLALGKGPKEHLVVMLGSPLHGSKAVHLLKGVVIL